ncbi:hypothetical protein [Elizabethkingia ursingii]|uniref:hypothetical protein n=1 Tax=Elizabethkingia ursingii TaxID=1756150 RepID=UPI000750DB16|nr:hypothetical protein [Elizabethkingia ursingii]KUY29397.1 hypothetical protein ATB96_18955 [Elizabethkingia ursingii]
MKKYLLLFGLIGISACNSRDDNNCKCYAQQNERTQMFDPSGKLVSDTGWKATLNKTDAGTDCDKNGKEYNDNSSEYTDKDGYRHITMYKLVISCQ